MRAYADTGFLCSLYVPDVHTARVIARMEVQALPLPLTWLHQIEFRNAVRLRVFRQEISREQRDTSIRHVLADLAVGVLAGATPSLEAMAAEAERLSASHSESLGTRSLDVLHVAMALVLGTEEFLGLDRRQNALARAAGLGVPDL